MGEAANHPTQAGDNLSAPFFLGHAARAASARQIVEESSRKANADHARTTCRDDDCGCVAGALSVADAQIHLGTGSARCVATSPKSECRSPKEIRKVRSEFGRHALFSDFKFWISFELWFSSLGFLLREARG